MARFLGMGSVRRLVVVAMSGAIALTASLPSRPAHASLFFDGACTMTLVASTSAPITRTSQFVYINWTGNGTCVAGQKIQSLLVVGQSGGNASCAAITQSGAFSFTFETGGASSFGATGIGTMSTMVWVWPGGLGWDSVGVLVGANAACLSGGTSTLTFTGLMPFQDP